MASQDVFLMIDADRISPNVERAVQTNNPEKLAAMSQNIERGDRLIRSWLEDRGGRVLLYHGDELYCSVPGEHLGELGKVHGELQEAWNDSITIGVGLDLNEAKKALDAGKKRGGSRIVFYAPEIEQIISDADEESKSDSYDATAPSPDPEKLKTLSKSNTPSPAGIHAAKHASLMSDAPGSPPASLTPYGPPQSAPSGETPLPPSSTNMADGLSAVTAAQGTGGPSVVEQQFHNAAAGNEAEAARAEGEANAAQAENPDGDKVKQMIVKILQKVKQQAPVLEQLKEQAPDAYKAVVGSIQAMLLMAKELMPQQQGQDVAKPQQEVQKSELIKAYIIKEGAAAKPKNTGIDNQVKVQSHVYKEEREPHEAPLPPGVLSKLSKIRKALKKKGLDSLPMPEETNKMPHRPSGSPVIRVRGKGNAPQAKKFVHLEPGEAAHVSADGKPGGKMAVRQGQSGWALPNEAHGEKDTGTIHQVSSRDPKDGRASQDNQQG